MIDDRRDEAFLRRALALAALGKGTTSPNPLVGAVVAKGGEVLAQAFHRRPGELHAEALALRQVGEDARGGTLYTNLEPCCHLGRTPPCTDEILQAGIERVVASSRDPNPKVNGGGFRALRQGGVRVDVGLLRPEATELNAAFIKRTRTGLPLVTLKGASSLDGRIATRRGDSKWVTSPSARRHGRQLRAENDAILVGVGTVLADDPRLSRRPKLAGGTPFYRVVLDGSLRTPLRSQLVRTAGSEPVLVFCGRGAREAKRDALRRRGVEVETVPSRGGRLDLEAVLGRLSEHGVCRLLVEGGGEVHASFLERRLADRVCLYLAPRLVGGRAALPLIGGKGRDRLDETTELVAPRLTSLGSAWLVEAAISDE